MRVAIATSSSLAPWELDDRPLHEAFGRLGVEIALLPWDDPGAGWSSFDACLIRTTWDYTERREEFVAWAERAAGQTRLFNGPELVRWNTDKRYLLELGAKGIPIPPTVLLERGSAPGLEALLAGRPWERAFLKPTVGATSRETLRFDTTPAGLERAEKHVARLLATDDLLLQPYLERVESEGELSAIFVDGELTHAVRKLPLPGEYRVQDDFGARDASVRLSVDESDLARRVVGALPHPWLYARVDFLRSSGGELLLNELEAVEPSLFFRHGPGAAEGLARGVVARIEKEAS